MVIPKLQRLFLLVVVSMVKVVRSRASAGAPCMPDLLVSDVWPDPKPLQTRCYRTAEIMQAPVLRLLYRASTNS